MQRRILSVVLESIRMEDPEYIDDIATKLTRTICDLIEKQKKFPEKDECVRMCSKISTQFFKFNRINRSIFLNELHERLLLSGIGFESPIHMEIVELNHLIARIGLSEEIEQKIITEIQVLRNEYRESTSNIMKSMLQFKVKMAVNESQLKDLQDRFESMILLLKISENEKKGLINRLKKWSTDVGLGIIGNFFYDVLKAISTGG
jgi:hypothetical protein